MHGAHGYRSPYTFRTEVAGCSSPIRELCASTTHVCTSSPARDASPPPRRIARRPVPAVRPQRTARPPRRVRRIQHGRVLGGHDPLPGMPRGQGPRRVVRGGQRDLPHAQVPRCAPRRPDPRYVPRVHERRTTSPALRPPPPARKPRSISSDSSFTCARRLAQRRPHLSHVQPAHPYPGPDQGYGVSPPLVAQFDERPEEAVQQPVDDIVLTGHQRPVERERDLRYEQNTADE